MKRILYWLSLFLVLTVSFQQADRIQMYSSTVSMRFDTALQSEQVSAARAYAEAAGAPWPSFWAEETSFASGVSATGIRFCGDAQLVFPADYLYGAPPNDLTPSCCALSDTLAWDIFGTVDATGLELEVNGQAYTVCGVFEHRESMLLCPAKESFHAVELSHVPISEDAYRYALDYAAATGFGIPSQVLCGPDLALTAKILCRSGVILCALCLLAQILKGIRKPLFVRLFAALVVLALPLWMNLLPQWWIPTRWGDMEFWSALRDSLLARPRDWITLSPMLRDLPVKYAWILLISASLDSCGLVLWVILKSKFTAHPAQSSQLRF